MTTPDPNAKPKRQLTEKQLANLRKGPQAAAAKRAAQREAQKQVASAPAVEPTDDPLAPKIETTGYVPVGPPPAPVKTPEPVLPVTESSEPPAAPPAPASGTTGTPSTPRQEPKLDGLLDTSPVGGGFLDWLKRGLGA